MNLNLLARTRIPLFCFLFLALFLWGTAIPAHADSAGPAIAEFLLPYPEWYYTAAGTNYQDALKFGDQQLMRIEVVDDVPITSVTADLSELGISTPVTVPLWLTQDERTHFYQTTYTVNTHTDGPATFSVTVTDELGRTTTESKTVQLDNTPPSFSIDSLSFVNTTTTPALEDTVLVSGSIDPNESKAFVTNTFYTLYAADGSNLSIHGSFMPKRQGVSLADLSIGPFTNEAVQFWYDNAMQFHVPEAAFISVTGTVIDGAGNSTTTTSPLFPIPHGGRTSNVLFLPGIEGSRLYESLSGTERKLWDPSSDTDVAELSLDRTGKSLYDIYTKEGDTIDEIGPFKFYRSFKDQMDTLKSAGTITDWESIAYDWRLSPSTIVQNGSQHGTHIDYGEATDTPYIEQTLRMLAATSKTGKVTIVAHSAGGLVAKALLQKLGDAETARLVDNVIFIGVPQSGTPQAVAGLLHGYGTALPADWCAAWEAIGSVCARDASRAQS